MKTLSDIFESRAIACAKKLDNGKIRLRLYNNGNIVFEKEYNTWKAAKAARTILLNNKYGYLFDNK